MAGYYTAGVKRQISAANHITYVSGILHPDRVMDEHDIVYILEGSWEILQDGISYPVGADDVILLHAGRHHYGIRPCSPNTKTMYIHFSCHEADRFPASTPNSAGSVTLGTVMHCQGNYRIKSRFSDSIAAYWSESTLRQEKLSALLDILLCELAENESGTGSRQDPTSYAIAELIHTTPDHFYTGEELAKRFFTCERTLRDRFRKAYGQSIYQYQMNTRLQMACAFLDMYPDATLREAARNFGFCDEYHLGKQFKRRYGVSPGAYKGKP